MGDVVGIDGNPVVAAAPEPEPAAPVAEAPATVPAPAAPAPEPEGFDWRKHYAGMTESELQREMEKLGGELGAELGRGIEMWLDFFAEPDKPGESLLKRVGRFFGG